MSELAFYPIEYRSENEDWPYHISSGGVVYRVYERKLQVLLLKREIGRGFSFHLPKGTVRIDETLEAAALREIAEEAGVAGDIVGYLGATSRNAYKSRIEDSKIIHYFAVRYTHALPTHDGSYDGAVWMSPEKAIFNLAKIKRKREDILVKRFVQLIKTIQARKK
jgi:ADP-ribose pyrophosphatase YjhB (NUDIX family)